MDTEKSIETVEMRVGDIKTGFGNPRKISKKKVSELERSLYTLGNFGIIIIDENDNVIAGNQRLSILNSKDPEATVLCKKLIGYTAAEKRAILTLFCLFQIMKKGWVESVIGFSIISPMTQLS